MSYRDRECYLGSTASLGFLDKGGRWRKKDWWTKKDSELAQDQKDMKAIQENDLNNIRQALGISDKSKSKKTLSDSDKERLLRKNSTQAGYQTPDGYSATGLGYDAARPEIKEESPRESVEKSKKKEHKRHKKHRTKEY